MTERDDITDEQRRLHDAMKRWQEAIAELRKCHDSCEYDRGYFCYRYDVAEKEAALTFFDKLDAYIDARIQSRRPGPEGEA